MDFLRPRAVPALIAALASAPSMAADCAPLHGTYKFASSTSDKSGQPADVLSNLGIGPREGNKLYRVDEKGSGLSLNATSPIRRPKTTLLATKATLKHTGSGTALVFLDAEGKTLVEAGIDGPGRWTCKGGRLERRSERVTGLGDSIRTERVDEVLERNAAGDLVHRETITVLDPKGIKPASREAVFPAIR